MAIQNVIGGAIRGATWVAIHNGGGVGWCVSYLLLLCSVVCVHACVHIRMYICVCEHPSGRINTLHMHACRYNREQLGRRGNLAQLPEALGCTSLWYLLQTDTRELCALLDWQWSRPQQYWHACECVLSAGGMWSMEALDLCWMALM